MKPGSDGFAMDNMSSLFTTPTPKWLMHLTGSLFLLQDMVLVHYQEKNINKQNRPWLQSCYTLTPVDEVPRAFRKWLKKVDGVGWRAEVDPLYTEEMTEVCTLCPV